MRKANVEAMKDTPVIALLKPLLDDSARTIQHNAALALSRMAAVSSNVAIDIIESGALKELLALTSSDNRLCKKAACSVIRSLTRASEECAKHVADNSGVAYLVQALDEFDPGIKENACAAIGNIARHNEELAYFVIEAGCLPYIISCYREPEVAVKRVAAMAISDIVRHDEALSMMAVDQGALPLLVKEVESHDVGCRAQACCCLSFIASHSSSTAELVVDAGVFPQVLKCLTENSNVASMACTLVREVVRHSAGLAKVVASVGGIAALLDYVEIQRGSPRVAGLVALGFIASFHETLAMAIVSARGLPLLVDVVDLEPTETVKLSAVWATAQISAHTSEHANAAAELGLLTRFVDLLSTNCSSEDSVLRVGSAIQAMVEKTTVLGPLEALILRSPPVVLVSVVQQLGRILQADASARRRFVQSGNLQALQRVNTDEVEDLASAINDINLLFPPEVINFYSEEYAAKLLERVEEYAPPNI